jgi:ABC-2 type transport system permease protein
MTALLREIYSRRELLRLLVARNLKIRYKGSFLGFFWSLLAPLFLILIYAVFAKILRFSGGKPNYLQFLVVGIIVWQFLSMCLSDSLHAVMGNVSLVKRTAFPRIVLPLAMVLANLVNFILTCVVLLLYLVLSGAVFRQLGLLPLVVVSQCALCLGLGLLISAVNVFFRDTEHIIGVATLAWFFLTPIFYTYDLQLRVIPPSLHWAAFLNPMTGIVSAYRTILLSQPGPASAWQGLSFAVGWSVLVLGVFVFQRLQVRFGDEL